MLLLMNKAVVVLFLEYVLVVRCKQTCSSAEFVEWKSKGKLTLILI